MAHYNPLDHTTPSADVSLHEFGVVPLQIESHGKERAAAFTSQPLTPTKTRHARVGKKALTRASRAERFQDFTRNLTGAGAPTREEASEETLSGTKVQSFTVGAMTGLGAALPMR